MLTRFPSVPQYVRVRAWPSFAVSKGLEPFATELLSKVTGGVVRAFPRGVAASPSHTLGGAPSPTLKAHWLAFVQHFAGAALDERRVTKAELEAMARALHERGHDEAARAFFREADAAFRLLPRWLKDIWAALVRDGDGFTESDDPLAAFSLVRTRYFPHAMQCLPALFASSAMTKR